MQESFEKKNEQKQQQQQQKTRHKPLYLRPLTSKGMALKINRLCMKQGINCFFALWK